MATRSVRVFITDARLSYPALDEPKETMAGNGDLKYQATFLITPDNPCVAKIKDAIKQIAIAEYGDKAKAVVTNREKIPLKKGDDKENIPDGYAGMLYISAKSKNRPELREKRFAKNLQRGTGLTLTLIFTRTRSAIQAEQL